MFNWSLLFLTLLVIGCSYEGQVYDSAPTASVDHAVQANQNTEKAVVELVTKNAVKPPAATAQRVSLKDNLGPENMCEGAITHNKRVHIPPVAKPPFGKYYKDPAFGSRVIRKRGMLMNH